MLSLLLTAVIASTPLGTFGNVYQIKEKDAYDEMQDRAKALDTAAIEKELKDKFKKYRPKDLSPLPPAEKTYSYPVHMRYTLDYDIPKVDAAGKIVGVMYPKGYTFNPVELLPGNPPPLIVFNGRSEKELKWVKHYYKGKPGYMFVMTAGDWVTVSEQLGTQVYYLKQIMVDKLHLKNTVSIVYRKGKDMQVDVYAIQ